MMHFLLNRAIQPALSLLDGLRSWNEISNRLRERPRVRAYQRGKWSPQFG
jgi:hypothetical protein